MAQQGIAGVIVREYFNPFPEQGNILYHVEIGVHRAKAQHFERHFKRSRPGTPQGGANNLNVILWFFQCNDSKKTGETPIHAKGTKVVSVLSLQNFCCESALFCCEWKNRVGCGDVH